MGAVTVKNATVVKDWIGLLCRLVLGGVLLVAGLLKIGNLASNVQSVRAYKLFGETLVRIIGYGLPIFEIVLGLLILVGVFTRWTALLGMLTMVAFIAGIAHAWSSGLTIDCGCFGDGGTVDASQTKYPQEILRDIGFALAGLWLVIRPRSKWSVDNWLYGTDEKFVDVVEEDDTSPEPETTATR